MSPHAEPVLEGEYIEFDRPEPYAQRDDVYLYFTGCPVTKHPLHRCRKGPITNWRIEQYSSWKVLICVLQLDTPEMEYVRVEIQLPNPYVTGTSDVVDV